MPHLSREQKEGNKVWVPPKELCSEWGLPTRLPAKRAPSNFTPGEKLGIAKVELIRLSLPITLFDTHVVPEGTENKTSWLFTSEDIHRAFPCFFNWGEGSTLLPDESFQEESEINPAVSAYETLYGYTPRNWGFRIMSARTRVERNLMIEDCLHHAKNYGIEVDCGSLMNATKCFFNRIIGLRTKTSIATT